MVDKKEILNQYYINAKELKMLVPSLGINKCREIIKYARELMKKDGCYELNTKPLIALTDYVVKILKLRS